MVIMKYRTIYSTAVCFISLSQFVAIPLKTVFFYKEKQAEILHNNFCQIKTTHQISKNQVSVAEYQIQYRIMSTMLSINKS